MKCFTAHMAFIQNAGLFRSERPEAADGDRSMTRRELRKARETVATLVRVQQQTDRLRAAVQAVRDPRRRRLLRSGCGR